MGLDISYYSKLVAAVGNEGFDEDGKVKYGDGWFTFYKNQHFPGRADDIQDGAAYMDSYAGGFRAGSYGGYNRWREQLAELAGYELTEFDDYGRVAKCHAAACWHGAEGPFSELINFSDCEGVIGATVSAKLALDFKEFQDKADQHCDDYFKEKYAEWRKAFETAADGGAVRFH